MARPKTNRKPTFFWQGLLILLPVVALAIVSLSSLHQDEVAAEQECREKAGENVQILAEGIRSSAQGEIQLFTKLESAWFAEMELITHPGVVHANRDQGTGFPSDKLKNDIHEWELGHPGIEFAKVAVPFCQIMADGTQITPPEFSEFPVPPKWFIELSPEQRALWQNLRELERTNANWESLRSGSKAFLKTHPSKEGGLGAQLLIMGAQHKENLLNSSGGPGDPPALTESGMPFQAIACYQGLTVSNATLTNAMVMQALWWQVAGHPNFFSPTLLDRAEGLTNHADAVIREEVYWLRYLWNSRIKQQEWLVPMREWQSFQKGDWRDPRWTVGKDEALAISHPIHLEIHEANGTRLKGAAYNIWFVQREVIEAVFDRIFAEKGFLIPEYVNPTAVVDGVPLRLKQGNAGTEGKPLLAELHWKIAIPPGLADLDLRFYLGNREKMLSAVAYRAKIFETLLLATMIAALAGLIAAWRGFRRQLQLNELKSNFVSSVSHELRAPIASVRLMAEGLERGRIQTPDKQQEYFRFIVQECRRLSSLIENVLDFSRIEQGRKQYKLESTDLVALTEQTVTLMATYAAEQQVEIRFSASGEPAPMELDGKAIQQALINLIDNAIKHSPKGATISVGLEFGDVKGGEHPEGWTPNGVRLWVEDKGEGIPATEHEKIFERFYRIGSELRRQTQGVGIGLSIVKHIVEAHGGRVVVRSAVGEGSTFTIELPASDPSGNQKPLQR